MSKMWSGRLDLPTEARFDAWQRSFPYDRRLLPYEIAATKAHAEALVEAGVLSHRELADIVAALGSLLSGGIPPDHDASIEDVHHFVERRIAEQIGEPGLKLHMGRSRNEQIATLLRLYVRDAVDHVRERVGDLIAALVGQAERAGRAVMPAYTHQQPAEPVLVAHWLLAYPEMFFRDADRLQECRERLNECPLGSGAVAGTVVPLDRAAMARKLGFDRPTANSMDATSDRDFAIEFVQHAALLASHVSRLAEDLILFASREYGFVQLPDAYCTGSSAMPQKKNPDALELGRVSAARVLGNSVALLASLKGLPLAYNKDLQETQMPVFETTERMVATLESVTGCVGDLQFETERMRAASSRGGMNALAAAACLVRHGVPFRVAHDAVGKAVRLSLSRQCELEDLAEDDVRGCGIEVPWAKLQASLQLDAVLGLHDVAGGTAPGRVAEALANARARWALLREATHEGA